MDSGIKALANGKSFEKEVSDFLEIFKIPNDKNVLFYDYERTKTEIMEIDFILPNNLMLEVSVCHSKNDYSVASRLRKKLKWLGKKLEINKNSKIILFFKSPNVWNMECQYLVNLFQEQYKDTMIFVNSYHSLFAILRNEKLIYSIC